VRHLLKHLLSTSPRGADLALLTVRLWFGLVLALAHGQKKITDVGAFAESVARRGVPFPELLGPAAALSEFIGGLLLALGLLTRPAACFVLLTMLVAAFHVHGSDPFAKKELALCFAAAALALLVAGPGTYSLDERIRRWLS
jgi:putative oxidoreductase